MKVLLISKDHHISAAVKTSFRKNSRHRLVTTSSAHRAQQLLHSVRPGIILLDLSMLNDCAPFIFTKHHVRFLVIGICCEKAEGFEETARCFHAQGGTDILRYPFSPTEYALRIHTAYRLRNTLLHNERLKKQHQRIKINLEECSDRLSAISNSIPAGIVIIDPETHVILDANTAALKLIGTEGDHVVGRICHQYICPAERGACPITDKKQSIDQSERVLVNIQGEQIPILKSVVRANLGGKEYLIEMFLDIRQQKKAEAERNALIEQLQQALQEVKTLSGLLPICASCKKIRDDRGYWREIELYIEEHANAKFTHGICPACMEKLYPEQHNNRHQSGSS
ncbi:MAG: PAS domain-containing protein [Desulfobacterota bacterium]|nr:PAS domain-containing protein [Thermodesulfobacteriota bacterium]